MNVRPGHLVLALSACGFPLTQLAIERGGVAGAALTEAVCAGLAIRDASMIASGVTGSLRRGPATLLWLELGAAVAAAATGAPRVAGFKPPPGHPLEIARRAAVGTLFVLHTARFGIYLGKDRGLRRLAA